MSTTDEFVKEMTNESSDVRKEAAVAMARVPLTAASLAALQRAAADSAPKVRKAAAIALGRPGNAAALEVLAKRLDDEEFDWVRASVVLAIGKIGGPDAAKLLASFQPKGEADAEAVAKAADRVRERPDVVVWRNLPLTVPLFATAPPGLEDVAAGEAAAKGLRAKAAGPGLLRLETSSGAGVLRQLRCAKDVRLLVGEGPSIRRTRPADLPQQLTAMLRASDFLQRWREWLTVEGDVLRYRFVLEAVRLPQSAFRATLSSVRESLRAFGLVDSASSYSALLIVEPDDAKTRIWLVPTFEKDDRFAYRVADVGASIHPIVGAALARLVRRSERGTVVDPTCGSATLLIERAMLDDGVTLHGIDISPTATAAAAKNIEAARLQARTRIVQGDVGAIETWPSECAEVLANLPFGVRSARMDRDLPAVYRQVVRNAAERLARGGRALFYTSSAQFLEPELAKNRALSLLEKRTIASGGINVFCWLLVKR